MLRRTVAMLLFLAVFVSSAEIVWAEGLKGFHSDQPVLFQSGADGIASHDAGDADGEDECPCLCESACAGVLSVVVPSLVAVEPAYLDPSLPTLLQENTPVSSFIELHRVHRSCRRSSTAAHCRSPSQQPNHASSLPEAAARRRDDPAAIPMVATRLIEFEHR